MGRPGSSTFRPGPAPATCRSNYIQTPTERLDGSRCSAPAAPSSEHCRAARPAFRSGPARLGGSPRYRCKFLRSRPRATAPSCGRHFPPSRSGASWSSSVASKHQACNGSRICSGPISPVSRTGPDSLIVRINRTGRDNRTNPGSPGDRVRPINRGSKARRGNPIGRGSRTRKVNRTGRGDRTRKDRQTDRAAPISRHAPIRASNQTRLVSKRCKGNPARKDNQSRSRRGGRMGNALQSARLEATWRSRRSGSAAWA